MSPCSRRARCGGAQAAGAAETVYGWCCWNWRAPGALPACRSYRSQWQGAAVAPQHPCRCWWARPCPQMGRPSSSSTAARFPRRHNRGLFAELPLIYGPCYLNINYEPGRQGPHPLPSRLIIF